MTPTPWEELVPRVCQREQGEKPITLSMAERMCFHCYLPDCDDQSPDCPLQVLGWLNENGIIVSVQTWKRKRRMG